MSFETFANPSCRERLSSPTSQPNKRWDQRPESLLASAILLRQSSRDVAEVQSWTLRNEIEVPELRRNSVDMELIGAGAFHRVDILGIGFEESVYTGGEKRTNTDIVPVPAEKFIG